MATEGNKRVSVPVKDYQLELLEQIAGAEDISLAQAAARAIRNGLLIEELRSEGEIISVMPDGTEVLVANESGVMQYRPVNRD